MQNFFIPLMQMKLPVDFEWEKYLYINDDVAKVYRTKEEAEQHYIRDGIKQNRLYKLQHTPSDFEWDIYLGLNNDVYQCCKSKVASIMHYEKHGFSENRKYNFKQANIPDDFDWNFYLENNADLKKNIKNKIEAIYHYYKVGKKRNLSYKLTLSNVPDDFNWEIYKLLNPDLQEIQNEQAAKIHYNNHGFKKKRAYNFPETIVPKDFDWKSYVEINTDVKQLYNNEVQAKYHYFITGNNEGRIYKFNYTPNDFDWKLYIKINPTIPKQYAISEYTAKLHYDLFGYKQNIPYACNYDNVPSDFDWKEYIHYNQDLLEICSDELLAKMHYNNYGFYQCRQYKKGSRTTNNKYNHFPFLFHKYILQIRSLSNEIGYNILSKRNIQKENTLIAHLHCYNIDQFSHFFGKHMKKIEKYHSLIVITFSIGNKIPEYNNIVCIKCANQGMDIGGKMVCLEFLKSYKINYKFILFLHSKTDDYMRDLYFLPILQNMDTILESIKKNTNIGIYVPPLIYIGDYATTVFKDNFVDPANITCKWNQGNSLYMNDIDRYFEYNTSNYIFPEGNCFICNSKIAESLYGNKIFYNLLNSKYSFDAIWVKSFYSIHGFTTGNTINEIFRFFQTTNNNGQPLHANNIAWGAGHDGHADNMYEHSFERIVFKVVQKCGFKIKIMPYKKDPHYREKLDHYNKLINNMLTS